MPQMPSAQTCEFHDLTVKIICVRTLVLKVVCKDWAGPINVRQAGVLYQRQSGRSFRISSFEPITAANISVERTLIDENLDVKRLTRLYRWEEQR